MGVSEYSDLVHCGRIIHRSRQVRGQMICATNACERMVELTYPMSNPDRFGEATRMIEDTWITMMRWAASISRKRLGLSLQPPLRRQGFETIALTPPSFLLMPTQMEKRERV